MCSFFCFKMHSSHTLELFPELNVTQILFKEVQNAAELRKNAIDGKIQGALINPTMKTNKMKTRSLFSEIIFNLSPTNNISEAFKRFGISDGDDSVLVVLIHDKDESPLVTDIATKVDGLQIPVDEMCSLSNFEKIKKLYKVTPQEEKCGTLQDAVICRMATKDVM
ncbi:EKC/KEOPS complex subunit TPRKB isoform X2 [Corythoichthys intestinalis]|uniref:EKC/KEOPS complex subunit TPRKB isoform X2 n=1 Tax=Corythoichthys intestinalis TaxID=161448 RepID=UPI0025A5D351|nr:EKC/KEOPS complex subunit TPRKB isoform X2 [Corythoichthys intestinalis]